MSHTCTYMVDNHSKTLTNNWTFKTSRVPTTAVGVSKFGSSDLGLRWGKHFLTSCYINVTGSVIIALCLNT